MYFRNWNLNYKNMTINEVTCNVWLLMYIVQSLNQVNCTYLHKHSISSSFMKVCHIDIVYSYPAVWKHTSFLLHDFNLDPMITPITSPSSLKFLSNIVNSILPLLCEITFYISHVNKIVWYLSFCDTLSIIFTFYFSIIYSLPSILSQMTAQVSWLLMMPQGHLHLQ